MSEERQRESKSNPDLVSLGVRKPLFRLSVILAIAVGLLLIIRYLWFR